MVCPTTLSSFTIPGQVPVGIVILVLFWCAGMYCGILMARYGDGTPLPLDATNRLVIRGPYR